MTREEMEELNGLAASMGLYDDRNPCKRAVILGKAIKELEQNQEKGTAYIQAIYTEALEEGIRCAMCTNTIKSDTGCDGGCIVDAKMYNKVMTEINSRLLRQPPVTPQEPNTWSLDDAREDFMHDVYNELNFLPTNEEANRIIDIFGRVTSSIEQKPCKEVGCRK